ncbi:MAG: hypothetical protein IPK13_24395 [Deltaproteobacteria bacterium]|nr:hypothetical protein [Deltaproteobacteria bacterium]
MSGVNNVMSYAIGINSNPGQTSGLQAIAAAGDGLFTQANSVEELRAALTEIFTSIASRSSVSYATFTVERDDSYFVGEYAYLTSYSPQPTGMFWGNLKKSCVLPSYDATNGYDTSSDTCIFKADPNEPFRLLTNPMAKDVWTGSTTTDTEVGGAGQVLKERLGDADGNPTAPYRTRKIYTWSPFRDRPWYAGASEEGYFPIELSLDMEDRWEQAMNAWTSLEEVPSYINRVHGYTWDHESSWAQYGDPKEVQAWPLGDSVHAPNILLRYGANCETTSTCWLVALANDGLVHFIDVADGSESSAFVPPEVTQRQWNPNTKRLLKDIERQPTSSGIHNYYIDGGARLYHEDDDADAIIDSNEVAYVIFGLGRGGRSYYRMSVSSFSGTPTLGVNDVYTLGSDDSNAFLELQETWAAPWLGRASLSDASASRIAIFPSGHVEAFDYADQAMPSLVPRDSFKWVWQTCSEFALSVGADAAFCDRTAATGYPDTGIAQGWGPYKYPNAVAYLVGFWDFDLDPSDALTLTDDQGHRSGVWTGWGYPAESWSGYAWWPTPVVFGEELSISLSVNGIQTGNYGYRIGWIDTMVIEPSAPVAQSPGLYVVDLDTWNGGTRFGSTTDDTGVKVRVTRDCSTASSAQEELCVDKNTSPDLVYMTCPISAEPSVYQPGDRVKAIYVGDECGQIWKIYPDLDDGTVRAVRLLSTNEGDFSDPSVSVGASKDIRKIFTRLDLVLSTCPGRSVVGIYFGAGNVQRPTATDELENASIAASGRDIVGLVWDDGSVDNLTLDKLANIDTALAEDVTSAQLYAAGNFGWYWNLADNEKMLRDPIVFAGTAFFKTHSPDGSGLPAAVCTNAAGVDRAYSVDNCTGSALSDINGDGIVDAADRNVWTGSQDIGGRFQIFTPKEGDAFVTTGDLSTEAQAELSARTPPKLDPQRLRKAKDVTVWVLEASSNELLSERQIDRKTADALVRSGSGFRRITSVKQAAHGAILGDRLFAVYERADDAPGVSFEALEGKEVLLKLRRDRDGEPRVVGVVPTGKSRPVVK